VSDTYNGLNWPLVDSSQALKVKSEKG
jgi:hypothetical protein